MMDSTFQLLPAQQDIYIDQLLNIDSARYNIGGYILLKGILDHAALSKSINHAPKYIDAFKMRFDTNAESMSGYVEHDYDFFELGKMDFSTYVQPASAAIEWMQARLNLPFILAKSNCLFEHLLLKISVDEHWLFGRFHHLIMDGYSFGIWLKYISESYRSMLGAGLFEYSFPSYLQHAALTNANAVELAANSDEQYWKTKIGAKPNSTFHKKYRLKAGETLSSSYSYELGSEEQANIFALAASLKVGIQQLTIAALLIYFGKTNAADSFVFGLPVHKRNSGRLRKTVGLFNGFIPFKGAYQGQQTIIELVHTIAATQALDYRHHNYSISRLFRHLQINSAGDNLWDIVINYLPFNTGLDFGSDLKASIVRMTNESVSLPMQVCWNDYGPQQPLELQIYFSKEYFDQAEIGFFSERLLYILHQFTIDKNKTAKRISIIPPREGMVLESFSKSKAAEKVYTGVMPFPAYRCLILDNADQQMPIGVEGELCFLNDLEAGHHVPPSTNFFRTGIKASWTCSGEIDTIDKNHSVVPDTSSQPPVLTNVCIAASFVAEVMEEYINYWSKEFDLNLLVSFAPYNQVFQQMLYPESLFNKGTGINVLLIRVEDWLRSQTAQPVEQQIALLQQTSKQFISAIKTSRHLSAKPCLVGILPWLVQNDLPIKLIESIKETEQEIRAAFQTSTQFYELDTKQIIKLFDVEEIVDIKSNEIGHIPFTDDMYAALGTFITRRIRSWKQPPYKVIAVDCDNTLWDGVCGEIGAMNVVMNEKHLCLQQFLALKYKEGFLLVLCSKNNAEDVWEVFDNHPGMLLKPAHFTDHRINWSPKPENIKALAKALKLNTDSFIFIDDSELEIEQMEHECPEVLSVHFPASEENTGSFLSHIWAFDIFNLTEEDANRNQHYRSEIQRKDEREKFSNLNEFIATLEVKVDITNLSSKELDRAVQLLMRTNQFNLNGIKRSHETMNELIDQEDCINWIIHVKDKFGDYGLVGLVLAKFEEHELVLNTFLLSCRVLGRNIETAILSELEQVARNRGINTIKSLAVDTGKNKPFLEFLKQTHWIEHQHFFTYNLCAK